MTAVDNWISDLNGAKVSDSDQPLISKVATAVAALTEIQNGLTPAGPEAANSFYAGPVSGAAALPTFRAMNVADVPAAIYGTQVKNTIYAGPATGANAAPGFRALVAADVNVGTLPTYTVLTPASASPYVPPAGCRQIEVTFCGAGASGCGATAGGVSVGVAGGDAVFNGITAKGGGASAGQDGGVGGTGGAGASVASWGGGSGGAGAIGGLAATQNVPSGTGGASYFGGGGGGVQSASSTGQNATAPGAGGGGASNSGSNSSGGAGGGAAQTKLLVIAVSGSIAFTLPAGAVSAVGTQKGGTGGDSTAVIREIY